MKAKIKATGEIVEISGNCLIRGGDAYVAISELEPLAEETPIDWELRRFELAKYAMQGFIANTDLFDRFEDTGDAMICLCSDSMAYADEMIGLLKGGKE